MATADTYRQISRDKSSFGLQLRILLWKNFTTKRRKPVIFLLELLIPLTLFIILILIRKATTTEPIPEEHYKPLPLLSAGVIPVLQSYCSQSGDTDPFSGNNTELSSFLQEMQTFFSDNDPVLSDFNPETLVRHLNNSVTNWINFVQVSQDFPLRDPVQNTTDYRRVIKSKYMTLPELIALIVSSNITKEVERYVKAWAFISPLMKHIPSGACCKTGDQEPDTPCDNTDMDKKSQTSLDDKLTKIVEYWGRVQPILCGEEKESLDKGVPSEQSETEKKSKDDSILTSHQKRNLQHLIHLLYSRPKILYTPNNLAANRIIQKADTLALFRNLTSQARQWLNSSSQIRHILSGPNHSEMFSTLTDLLDDVSNAACVWLSITSGLDFDIFKGFRSEPELEDYFLNRQYHDNVTVLAGVVFENLNDSTQELPPHLRYKIRQNATLTPPTSRARGHLWYPNPGSDYLLYYKFGFVWIQDAIERAVIDLQTGNDVTEPGTYLKRMPYPCWLWDHFGWVYRHNTVFLLMLSWIYMVSMLVQKIVYEKEKGLKEVMKMMGLSNAVHWCAWFITAFLQMTLTVVAVTLILCYGHILAQSNPCIVFLYLEVFAVSSIAMSFAISSVFSKAKLAAAFAGIFYTLTHTPYVYILIKEEVSDQSEPIAIKMAACIFSPSAMVLGGKHFLYYEMHGEGVQWNNLNKSPFVNDLFSLQTAIFMILIDTIVYLLLAWYIENVHPGTYGLSKPWYFPVLPSYWGLSGSFNRIRKLFGSKHERYLARDDDEELLLRTESWPSDNTEEDREALPVGVTIENLSKTYDKRRPPAVKNLSLTLYKNQITCFLGHNGAGKTTSMSLLIGLFPPSSGNAFINGSSILTDMDTIRQNLGICPQHNILFESLTVEEHLWFYARLKGMKPEDICKETSRLLQDLGITKKRKVVPSCLSGGMQRKLSVAIAFVGDASTVILDEPTAGIDPHSRRAVWNLLHQYKKGRTILLSTHHMDEAEIVGDKIAIISNGEVMFSGSPTFLKSKFGDGQHLHIIKNELPVATSDTALDIDILERIQTIIPAARISSSSSAEVHIVLPIAGPNKSKIAEVLDMLQKERAGLRIQTYGVNDSDLIDVFVKVTELQKDQQCNTDSTHYEVTPNCPSVHLCDMSNDRADEQDHCPLLELDQHSNQQTEYMVGNHKGKLPKLIRHFTALIKKRFHYTKRYRKGIISQIILPTIFISISMTIALSSPKVFDPPPITLSTSQFFNLTQPKGNFVPYYYKQSTSGDTKRKNARTMDLVQTFQMPPGIGETCVLQSPYITSVPDMVRQFNASAKYWTLFEKYFDRNCRNVITKRAQVDIQFPSSPFDKKLSSAIHSLGEANITAAQYYPQCQCAHSHRRFVCSTDGYVDPPRQSVITGDVLQDISGSNEEDFYLYTTDKYLLHRYGGFSFGSEIPYAPEDLISHRDTIVNRLVVKQVAQVRYNQKGYHSMPVYLNALNNAILRANLPQSKGNPAAYGITVVNHPMTKTKSILDTEYIRGDTDVLMSIFIIVAMAFVPASFVVFIVHERAIKAKHLQFMSGINPIGYWMSNYIFDMCNYLIPASCIVIILIVFQVPAYTEKDNFQAVMSLFLLYGWSITPMMYPASFVFRESSVAYIVLIMINLFSGITCVMTTFLLDIFPDIKNLQDVNDVLKVIFLFFPNFCLGNGMMEIALNHYKNEFYMHTGLYDKVESPLQWHLTGRRVVAMAITGIVFFVITVLYEFKLYLKIRKIKTIGQAANADEDDDDVRAERERTLYGNGQTDLLRIENLKKIYPVKKGRPIVAVDGLTFAVPRGECYGLLGVNGAGKTSTFKMLTGDIQPSGGDAKLDSNSILTDLRRVQENIGYCPQFDALFDELTTTEHLQLYARLRGIPTEKEQRAVQDAIDRLSLQKYAKQSAGTLSGGNKRKLSTAISLIGNPPLILMDEPTTGMDPYSRRFLWNTIKDLVHGGTSVLFTSHSMEECENLCSRLSIMVNGQLKCLGSTQHLKNKFGDGYTLKVIMTSIDEIPNVTEHLIGAISGCRHMDSSHRTLIFDVKTEFMNLADVYRVMEHACTAFQIEDYSLSQNNLDKVFINFAKLQTGTGAVRGDDVSCDTAAV